MTKECNCCGRIEDDNTEIYCPECGAVLSLIPLIAPVDSVYVVTLYRKGNYGFHEGHSYVLGVYKHFPLAQQAGVFECELRRGGKYTFEVTSHKMEE